MSLDIVKHFATEVALILSIIFGFFSPWRKQFGAMALLFFITTILNTLAKLYFMVPLPPALGIDWTAFPSGHQTSGFAFWGLLCYYLRNRLAWLTFLAVSLIHAYWMVIRNFHFPTDIIASGTLVVGTAVLCAWVAKLLDKSWDIGPKTGLLFCFICALGIMLQKDPFIPQLIGICKLAGLLGAFSISWMITNRKQWYMHSFRWLPYLTQSLLAIGGIFLIQEVYKSNPTLLKNAFGGATTGIFIALWAILAVPCIANLLFKFNQKTNS